MKGESFHASRRAYQLYRSYQFGYSEDQTIIDANYFQEKVLSPNFALPIEGYFVLGKFHVSDGFHRLAIAAAHDLEFIPSLVSRRMRTLIERP